PLKNRPSPPRTSANANGNLPGPMGIRSTPLAGNGSAVKTGEKSATAHQSFWSNEIPFGGPYNAAHLPSVNLDWMFVPVADGRCPCSHGQPGGRLATVVGSPPRWRLARNRPPRQVSPRGTQGTLAHAHRRRLQRSRSRRRPRLRHGPRTGQR